jgi:hypothetical protein
VNELSPDAAVLPNNGCDGKGIEGKELERNVEDSKEDKSEVLADVKVEADTLSANVVEEEAKTGQGENPCDSVSQSDNDEEIPGVTIKCVNANDKETQQSQTPVDSTELTQTSPLLDIKDLDTVIEDVIIPKKKKLNKKQSNKKLQKQRSYLNLKKLMSFKS